MTPAGLPTATYRLQFREGMDFERAVAIVPYLRDLGVSHLYASPVFTAPAGSTHGYDVADHNEIDPALGGRAGFDRLVEALQSAGLGLMLDIVPNHMAASLENPWWRSVVQWGEQSPFARHFDIDWSRRLTLPILGQPFEAALAAGDLRIDLDAEIGTLALRYFDNALPLLPSTWGDILAGLPNPLADRLAELGRSAGVDAAAELHRSVREVAGLPQAQSLREELAARSADRAFVDAAHRRQPWELIFWKEARRNLSYRRFFEVTGLVGVRVEDEPVFDDVHRLTLELVRAGQVQGLRVDHVDGLADPGGYLRRLRDRIGPDVYLVVEKILGEGEALRRDWPVQGSTGYEFIDALADVLPDGSGVARLSRAYEAIAGTRSIEEQRLAAKTQVLTVNFEGEVATVARLIATAAGGEIDAAELKNAVVQLVVAMPVYRIYGADDEDRTVMRQALEQAVQAAPALDGVLRPAHDMMLGDHPGADTPEGRLARERFQQLTGPAMAKGIEDTLFYRDHRFIAFNEVGCDPARPAPSLGHFHRSMMARSGAAPHGLSATATHDTKRGEDARARLIALSEMPDEWSAQVERWRANHAANATVLPGGIAPEPGLQWLICQALAGCWPAEPSEQASDAFGDRFLAYLGKVLREAKQRTNWIDIDEGYEEAVKRYAVVLLADGGFRDDMNRTLRRLAVAGWLNSLAQTILKLTAPGIPDIYQGSEAEDFSLVDPDNRRPVDFEALSHMLRRGPGGGRDYPALKQRLIARLLAARREHSALFAAGDYLPLDVSGPKRDHVVAFARTHGDRALIVVAPRLTLTLLDAEGAIPAETWSGTTVTAPAGRYSGAAHELISARPVALRPAMDIAELLAEGVPAALLCVR